MTEHEKAALKSLAEGLVENADESGLQILLWQSRFIVELAETRIAEMEAEHEQQH